MKNTPCFSRNSMFQFGMHYSDIAIMSRVRADQKKTDFLNRFSMAKATVFSLEKSKPIPHSKRGISSHTTNSRFSHFWFFKYQYLYLVYCSHKISFGDDSEPCCVTKNTDIGEVYRRYELFLFVKKHLFSIAQFLKEEGFDIDSNTKILSDKFFDFCKIEYYSSIRWKFCFDRLLLREDYRFFLFFLYRFSILNWYEEV